MGSSGNGVTVIMLFGWDPSGYMLGKNASGAIPG